MKDKPNILIITGVYPPEIGGPATYTMLMERELPKYGIRVKVLPFNVVKKYPKIIRHVIFLIKILQLGRSTDLLYAQDPVSVGFPSLCAAKILRKLFLIRIPGDYAWERAASYFGLKDDIETFQKKKYAFKIELLKMVERYVARSADMVITPSDYFKKLVQNWNPKIKNVHTIHNGVDVETIPNNNGGFEKMTIISAGRLIKLKGFDFLVGMMKNLPGWKLKIVGDGPERENLDRLIGENNLADRVKLLGNLSRRDLIYQVQKSEVFVLNSISESFSFQVVEAMAAGTPVIATGVGGIIEIIKDGEDGLLFYPNDRESLLSALAKIHDSGIRESLLRKAKTKTKQFSIQHATERTLKIINELLAKSK
jgi:glycosyltransferase involved in cell wall biosynthesis